MDAAQAAGERGGGTGVAADVRGLGRAVVSVVVVAALAVVEP